jgi:hypothetical protein
MRDKKIENDNQGCEGTIGVYKRLEFPRLDVSVILCVVVLNKVVMRADMDMGPWRLPCRHIGTKVARLPLITANLG